MVQSIDNLIQEIKILDKAYNDAHWRLKQSLIAREGARIFLKEAESIYEVAKKQVDMWEKIVNEEVDIQEESAGKAFKLRTQLNSIYIRK